MSNYSFTDIEARREREIQYIEKRDAKIHEL